MMPDLRFTAVVTGAPPADIIARMTADLVRANAGSEEAAIRALMAKYGFEIAAFADQALAAALQRRAPR